jgi:hypothetical protein
MSILNLIGTTSDNWVSFMATSGPQATCMIDVHWQEKYQSVILQRDDMESLIIWLTDILNAEEDGDASGPEEDERAG